MVWAVRRVHRGESDALLSCDVECSTVYFFVHSLEGPQDPVVCQENILSGRKDHKTNLRQKKYLVCFAPLRPAPTLAQFLQCASAQMRDSPRLPLLSLARHRCPEISLFHFCRRRGSCGPGFGCCHTGAAYWEVFPLKRSTAGMY